MSNPNHPKKGDRITVEPIRDLKDIESIKKILSSKTRDLLLFTMGINNGLRCGDLLKIKVFQVSNLKPVFPVVINGAKNGRQKVYHFGDSVAERREYGVIVYLSISEGAH